MGTVVLLCVEYQISFFFPMYNRCIVKCILLNIVLFVCIRMNHQWCMISLIYLKLIHPPTGYSFETVIMFSGLLWNVRGEEWIEWWECHKIAVSGVREVCACFCLLCSVSEGEVTWPPTVRKMRVSVVWRAPMFVLLLYEVCFLSFRIEI
jgi:hypothetical protein